MNHLLAWIASLVQRHRHTGLDGSQLLGPDSFPGGSIPAVNQLQNGGFEVWQRGTSFINVANGATTVDRWQFFKGGSSTLNVDKETGSVDKSEAAARLTYSHNALSTLYQLLETPANYRGRTLALSIRIATSTPNAVRVRISDSAGAGTPSSFHPGDGAYHTLQAVKTITSNPTSVSADVVLEASATVYVDNAMLVVGETPSEYVPKTTAEEMAQLLRFYEASGGNSTYQRFSIGNCYSTTGAATLHQYAQRKRAVPTITLSAANTFAVLSGATSATVAAIIPAWTDNTRTDLDVTTSGMFVVGAPALVHANNTLSARISVEVGV